MVASDSSYPFSPLPATNGGSASNTFCSPSVIVVLFSQARHPHGLYSAVETGMTCLVPSFTFTFLPPSLAKPGTIAGADGGRLNMYDVIRSSVVHAETLRARQARNPLLGVCGLENSPVGLAVRLRLSSSYWPV